MSRERQYRVLGPLEARVGERPLALGGPKQRGLLAALLLHGGQVVAAERLIRLLWGDEPPRTAATGLHGLVSQLRRALDAGDGSPSPLVSRRPGYVLEVAPGELDLHEFERLVREGRRALLVGEAAGAADRLRSAGELWRGPALGGVTADALLQVEVPRLEELRIATLEDRIEADLTLGRHAEVVAELAALVGAHPFRERFRGQQMLALHRCGRQAEALECYRAARRAFVEELGLEPGQALQQLERAILARDPSVDPPGPQESASPTPPPAQLPADLPDFTGRTPEVARLGRLLEPAGPGGPDAMKVCAIAGKPGVGKSALALHVAHRLKAHFPDAQLYADLRAEDERQAVAAVLAGFLRALGVRAEALPPGLAQQAALYRSLLAGRRALVLIDNARDERQVRPLLPGSSGCVVLVTSRSPLAALAGVELCDLHDMEGDDAASLLLRVAGTGRADLVPDVVSNIVGLCGRLPLAIRIAGALIRTRPHWSAIQIVRRLADERRRLDELRTGDLDVRASFTLSYEGLPEREARIFRLLAVLPGSDFSAGAATAAAGEDAEDALERLCWAQLLLASGGHRYRLHDLLRLFAGERLERETPEEERRAALERGLLWYLDMAGDQGAALHPHERDGPHPTEPGAMTRAPARDGLVWFETERSNLVAAVARAAAVGLWGLALDLGDALAVFFAIHSHWTDEVRVGEIALDAARALSLRRREGQVLNRLGIVHRQQVRWEEAASLHQQAQSIFEDLADPLGRAWALTGLGGVRRHQGRWEEARRCHEQALATFRQLGDSHGQGRVLNSLGIALSCLGHIEAATACFEQSLAICRETGDRHCEGWVLLNMGDDHREQGRLDEAVACLQQGLAIFRQLDDSHCESSALGHLGLVNGQLGRWEEAVARHQQSLSISRELGDGQGEAQALIRLGVGLRHLNRWEGARACSAQGLAICRQLGDRDGQGDALAQLGDAYREAERWKEAVACLEEAAAIFDQLGDQSRGDQVRQSLSATWTAREAADSRR